MDRRDAGGTKNASLRTQVTDELVARAGNSRAAWESIVYQHLFHHDEIRRQYIRAAFFLDDTAPDLERVLSREDADLARKAIRKGRARIRHVLRLLDPKPGDRIADIGCGYGGIVWACGQAGAQAVGCDLNPWIVREGIDLGAGDLSVASCDALPFETGIMSKISCINVLEHVPDKDAAFKEFRRVLRPGGRLVLYTDNPTHVYLRVAVRRVISNRNWAVGYSGFAGGHTDLVGPDAVGRLLGQHGFRVNRLTYSLPSLPAPVGRFLSNYFAIIAEGGP